MRGFLSSRVLLSIEVPKWVCKMGGFFWMNFLPLGKERVTAYSAKEKLHFTAFALFDN